jgi:hypothetical protein
VCGLEEPLERTVNEQGRSFLPGTIILPVDDYREIYFLNPKHKERVWKGSYIYFAGNVPHGGVTYDLDDKAWHPSVHVHLDSSLIKRGKTTSLT